MSIELRCGGDTAVVHPEAGMLVSSWVVDGTPVLAELATPEQYVEQGTFTGMPLMYPWANRLGSHWLPTAAGPRPLPRDPGVTMVDPSGLPLHGAHPQLLRFASQGPQRTAAVTGVLQWGRDRAQLDLFPVEHEVSVTVTLEVSTLTVDVQLRAGSLPLPVSFGLHPYLRLDSPADQWRLELPARTPVVLDGRGIPTGDLAPRRDAEPPVPVARPLDDGFIGIDDGTGPRVTDGARSIEVTHVHGYPCAQVYAPAEVAGAAPFVCLEPMTARTNALQSGTAATPVAPGATFTATCELRVSDRPAAGRGPTRPRP